eukprot:CAMPEP_0197628060 /NCGR_PEP_ID=MMETSP1338-20131121/6484_1 /TAXON_ID=43686 ORGANISM="Pelagodinium beii, Strain RCC1491" /NCGR_SAMPLE_ID=MMETSP1338 /ASSEMBLY_ACC=CAM_ASM_000754 /LENGTH=494 /DNA_ID=CAMNT_0043198943 /DNA_START=46 /DNA_END=1530 /DNA_ORIENTATION=+
MGAMDTDRLPTVRSLRVLKLIAMLHENRDRLLEVVSFLPPAAFEEFCQGGRLEESCRAAFLIERQEGRGCDPDGDGISAEHLGWVILPKICASVGPASVSGLSFDKEAARAKGQRWEPGLAVLFVAEASGRGSDFILVEDFVEVARLAAVMCYLGNLQEQHSIVNAHRSPGTESLLKVIKDGSEKLGEIVVFLPQQVRDTLLSKSFAERCLAEFDALDSDRSQNLEIKMLHPVLVVLGMAERLHVTVEQCKKFTHLIGSNGASVRRAEMVNFSQFMLALCYLDTTTGQVAADNACIVLGERRVEELLSMLEKDKQAVSRTELLMPGDAVEYLNSQSFKEQCLERFRELDVEKKGALESTDLFHVVAELSGADPFSVSVDQCERFVATFGNLGALIDEEFVVLARHLCTMAYLHSDRGRGHLLWALECMKRGDAAAALSAPAAVKAGTLQEQLPMDLDFYKGRSQTLEDENAELKEKMRQMEEVMRQITGKPQES